MKFCSWIVLCLFLLNGTLTQDFDLSDVLDDLGGFGLDLEDALGPDLAPKPDKPSGKPPKSRGGGGGGFDLEDAFGPVQPTPAKPKEQPKPPKQPDGGFGLDLADIFGPENPTDSPTGGACPKDLDQKLNRIIENQEKLLKLVEQQRPRTSSRFWPTR